MDFEISHALGYHIDPCTLYAILRLRSAVFVVEQESIFLDLDGRDLEASTRHFWIGPAVEPLGSLRLLQEPNGTFRIGRVVTPIAARGKGIGTALMRRALEVVGPREAILHAQVRQSDWYRQFGFDVSGPQTSIRHNVAHLPMRRPANTAMMRPGQSVATELAAQ